MAKRAFTAAYVQRLLARHNGSVTLAARTAGVTPGSFYKWMRRTTR